MFVKFFSVIKYFSFEFLWFWKPVYMNKNSHKYWSFLSPIGRANLNLSIQFHLWNLFHQVLEKDHSPGSGGREGGRQAGRQEGRKAGRQEGRKGSVVLANMTTGMKYFFPCSLAVLINSHDSSKIRRNFQLEVVWNLRMQHRETSNREGKGNKRVIQLKYTMPLGTYCSKEPEERANNYF